MLDSCTCVVALWMAPKNLIGLMQMVYLSCLFSSPGRDSSKSLGDWLGSVVWINWSVDTCEDLQHMEHDDKPEGVDEFGKKFKLLLVPRFSFF